MRTTLYILFMLVTLDGVALAQSDQFETYTKSAREWYAAGEFAAAAELFREAYNVEPRGNLLYNIAHCYEKAEMFADAVTYYEKYLVAFPDAKVSPSVREKVAALKANLKPPSYTISVNSQPPDAQVFLDDKSDGVYGQTPTDLEVGVGAHQVFVEKEGHMPQRLDVDGQQDQKVVLDVVLQPKALMGSLVLEVSRGGTTVLIDGHKKGISPFTDPLQLTAGKHVILAMKPGYVPWREEVAIPTEKEIRVQVNLRREKDPNAEAGPRKLWPWLAIGAGALSTITGTTLGLQAQKLHDQLAEKQRRQELIAQSDISTGSSMVVGANVLFGIGAAAIGAGIVWLFLPEAEENDDFDIELDVGRNDGSPTLIVRGCFR